MKHHRARGLTLLEVAIVLAVMAVLAALALPALGHRSERQRLQFAAESLAGDLAEARFEAARRGQALYVETRTGPDWCWAVAASSGCSCSEALSCQVHRVAASTHRGVRLTEGLAVRLSPDGGANGAQTIAVLETRRGDRLHVEVSALGRARVCASGGTWPALAPC
jgi:type IV fimbrial biogenesis protein FimT